MSAVKKKKGITLLVLVLLLAILIGAYFLLVKYNKDKQENEKEKEDTGIMLSLVKSDDIIRIDYSNQEGSLTLEKKEDKWINGESKKEVEEADIVSILNEISEIKASKLVTENPDDLSEYGLDKPAVMINASLKDGSSVSIGIGSQIPDGGGYYGNLVGEEKVYVVPESLYQRFSTII